MSAGARPHRRFSKDAEGEVTYFRRGQGGPLDDLSALAAAVAAGLATFYLVRVWLQREELGEKPHREADSGEARSSAR